MSDFVLHAECLASKWGFGDGDALNDYMYDLRDEGLISQVPNRDDFLYAVVCKYLLPELHKRGVVVDLVNIGSIHNPVRAERVNGAEVDWYGNEPRPEVLRDVSVAVPRYDLIAMCTEHSLGAAGVHLVQAQVLNHDGPRDDDGGQNE